MSKFLEECERMNDEQNLRITRVSEIVGDGQPETAECTPANPCQNVYSVAKTFTATAIGILYDRGLVKPQDKVCDILRNELPGYGMDERWENVTVHMALTHSAGLPGDFLDIDTHKSSEFTEDFLTYLFTYPLDYEPGKFSKYSDGAFYLLARIAEKLCGMPLDNFLWKEALVKLDFQEMAWSHCPRGHVIGATGLYIHSSDMAKLGAVYLNGGVYNGHRILSKEWVDLAVENEYGLDWDVEHRTYSKGGMCGQRLLIDPPHNRVVAVQSFCGNCGAVIDFAKDFTE